MTIVIRELIEPGPDNVYLNFIKSLRGVPVEISIINK